MTSASTASPVNVALDVPRGRPRYIVIFREPSERNTSRLSNVLSVGQSKRGSRARAGLLELRPKHEGHAATLVYERLGVAVADLNQEERDRLVASNEVESIEPNEIQSIPPIPEMNSVSGIEALPGDKTIPSNPTLAFLTGLRYAADLALRAIEADRGQTGTSALPQSGSISWCLDMIGIGAGYNKATGKGVSVAVLDTGIDLDHPDFRGRLIEGVHAVSFVEGESVRDLNGHGTHCAGVVAGPASPASGTRYGVAPDVTLLVGKVLGGPDGEGYDSDILEGIDWAADQGARVISMSLGSIRQLDAPYPRKYERVASNLLRQSDGPLIVAAAGNESNRPTRIAPVGNPAACPSFMAIAAINSSRAVAYFSCGGVDSVSQVDLAAPGVAVMSAWIGGGYKSISGTSMATPHVAGVAALYLELNSKMTPQQLWQKLISKASSLSVKRDFGSGLVRVP